MLSRWGKEDLVRQRTISACILQSYLTQSWIQEYKELALILELLYSQNKVCVHFLGWEVGVMRWMVCDSCHHTWKPPLPPRNTYDQPPNNTWQQHNNNAESQHDNEDTEQGNMKTMWQWGHNKNNATNSNEAQHHSLPLHQSIPLSPPLSFPTIPPPPSLHYSLPLLVICIQ